MMHIFLMLSSVHVFNKTPHINQKLDLIPSEHVLCRNPLSPGFFLSFLKSEISSRTFGLIVSPVKLFYPNTLPALHQLFVLFSPRQEDVSSYESQNCRPGPPSAVLHRNGYRTCGQQEIQVHSWSGVVVLLALNQTFRTLFTFLQPNVFYTVSCALQKVPILIIREKHIQELKSENRNISLQSFSKSFIKCTARHRHSLVQRELHPRCCNNWTQICIFLDLFQTSVSA